MRHHRERSGTLPGRGWRIPCSILLLITHSAIASPQKSTTSVSGRVYDQSAAILPGATVRLILFGGGFNREIQTDAGVSYRFKRTERWQYRVQFNIKNLLDRRYYESATSDLLAMPAAPRTAMVSLQMTFK